MKQTRILRRVLQRLSAIVLCATIFMVGWLLPASAWEPSRVIRVGAFPYEGQLQIDEFGNYSGYGYEYLQEIARYTGWQYEFVDKPWDECLLMLERGELDLMGAMMQTPERESRFSFSQYPLLSGYGVLATSLDNQILPYEDFQAFQGLRVGLVHGNAHETSLLNYSRTHHFQPNLLRYDTQSQVENALEAGEVEAIVATNILRSDTLRVVATFGENDAFFATTKGRDDILEPLNEAMRQIRLSDPYFNSKLDQKYFDLQVSTTISFTREELDFIQQSGPIPCTYIPHAPPFNDFDRVTGRVQGIAVDMCNLLTERTGLEFQWIDSKSASQAVDLLQSGQALLVPAKYHDLSWAEQNHVRLTTPYLQGQMVMISGSRSAVPEIVATYDQDSQGLWVAQAVSSGTQIKEFANLIDCIDAVQHGNATTTYVNSTIASHLINDPRYSDLQTAPLYGYTADVAMAVSDQADPLLLSVLNKGLRSISTTELNQSLLKHMKQPQVNPFIAHLYQHPIKIVLLVAGGFALLIATLLLLLYKMYQTLYTDPLTGRPNFRALSRDAKHLLGHRPERYALVYMDIRRFKVINDTFGYDAGDSILKATSDALLDFIGPGERMARIHSDEFAMLLCYEGQVPLQTRLDALSQQLGNLSYAASEKISPLYKGGIYPLTRDFQNLEVACDRAHYAKDSITHLISNTFAFYDDVIHIRVLQEKELEDSMYPALERGEFIPFYQPKINAVTEKVVGAEALVRWMHPEKGCLSPAEFIPFYEKNGFVVNIDLSIFEQVCRDISLWLQSGSPVVLVSVNFSRRNIQNMQLPMQLKEIADRYQVPTSLLEIEVTETEELEDLETAVAFVAQLRSFGFKISVDDYGTGYSSISFLQQLPMDALKLDRKFILNAMLSDKAEDIMRYLVATMHKNRVRIICEGVEINFWTRPCPLGFMPAS